MNRHQWKLSEKWSGGVKQCQKCGIVREPGHRGEYPIFWRVDIGEGLIGQGKTPPCEPGKEGER